MVHLVPSHSESERLRLLAERIAVSQRDEIKLMQRWLALRHEAVPDPEVAHEHTESAERLMPGMLRPEEVAQLAQAKRVEFERLFLELMIRHHEGALTMVAQLFATPGAGQESAIFRFASEVDADQRAEIRRMRPMLEALGETPQR